MPRPQKRTSNIKFAFAKPEDDENRCIVSMLEHQGRMYMATEKGIYRLEGEKVIRLEIVDNTPLKAPNG